LYKQILFVYLQYKHKTKRKRKRKRKNKIKQNATINQLVNKKNEQYEK